MEPISTLSIFADITTHARAHDAIFPTPPTHHTQIFANDNRLTSLPANIFADNHKLAYIRLENNLLVHAGLPVGLFKNNKKLATLHLSNNLLSAWPVSLAERSDSVHVLNMASNTLVDIPTFVNRMPNLKYLDVSNNNITSLNTLAAAATGSSTATASAQRGLNETLLLLGENPVCNNGSATSIGGMLGATWFASCESQCSSTCPQSILWEPARIKDMRGNGYCDIGCNTTACRYDDDQGLGPVPQGQFIRYDCV